MSEISDKVRSFLGPILESREAFLIDLSIRNERGGKVIQIFADTDAGITIDQCAEVSREIARQIDIDNLIEGSYRLEVSSPGIDKPLLLLRQYRKNIGRRFKVVYQEQVERSSFVGTLETMTDETLTFVKDRGESVTLEFSKIIESREVMPW